MIWLRKAADPVRPGLNITRGQGVVLCLPWTSLYVKWRPFRVSLPFGPWARVAALEARVASRDAHIAELQRALAVSADRYDLVREMNAQLRQTLELYRKA